MKLNTEEGLKQFTKSMKLKLDLNQQKKGDSWVDCALCYLMDALDEEIQEYREEVNKEKYCKCAEELVDIANFCMMLHHRYMQTWENKFRGGD